MIRRIQLTLLMLLIGVWAMASDTSVKNADGVEIWYDFDSSTKTASVTYRGSYYSAYSNEYTGEVIIPSKVTYNGVEYSVTSIGGSAFWACSGLTSVTIPKSVAEIGGSAFEDCRGLTSVTIPEGVTLIGDHAFRGCSGLTSVTIPESVTKIGYRAFFGCSGLTSVTISEGVTSIGVSAFEDCSGLTSVTIPEGVTSIRENAFYNCSGLTSVTIPKSVTYIGSFAFSGTAIYNNESNWENNVLYIDNCLIDVKTELSGEYAIKEDTRLIANYAFRDCSGLTSVTIPEGVTEIGKSAFEGCSGLTSVTIPEGVTSIVGSAFYNCSGLTSVTIPEGVKSIGNNAFRDCIGLTSVTIPKGVTEIGECAFYDCRGLTSITSKNTTPPTVGTIKTFYKVDKSIPLYVPAESVEAYKSAEGWKEFTNILPIQADGNPISEVKADNISVRSIGNTIVVTGTDNYTVYSISGQSLGKVTNVERGIYIVVAEGKSYKVAIK